MLPALALAEVAAEQWQAVRSSDGIQIFTAKPAASPIIKVKAVAEIDAGMDTILAILDDETRYAEWVPYLAEARILQNVSKTEKLVYNLFDAPWPARDRDFIYRLMITSQTENEISYTMQSVTTPLMPEKEGVVRAVLIEARYSLTSLNDNQSRIELVFHADLRGHLPVWIVNIVHRSFTFDAIKGLMAQVKGEALEE